MADDKKGGGGGGTSIGGIFFYGMAVLFIMWIMTGGPARTENKYNPFLREPAPLDDFSVYGAGSDFQTGVETIIQEGVHTGWKVESRGDFSFLTPPLWSTNVSGDFDGTEFGEITNGTITLQYQYGRTANELDFENNPDYEVEYGTVNDRWARFVRPKNAFGDTTGAFIKKNKRKRITIYTNEKLTPEEERQVFEIINTVRI